MNDSRICPECGAEIPAGSPEGLCPKCLMKRGIEEDSEIGTEALSSPPGSEGGSRTPPGGFEPPDPSLLAAQFPNLKILELAGRGGMGAVYKARQPQLDRLVALKILPEQIGEDPSFTERFTREARALAKLNHPNIVAVYDFGKTDQGLFYFIMEYIDGPNLRRVIRKGDLEPPEALAIIPQICEALQYAHEEGVVHRDIKPENVLLDKKGRVKIADFGLAKLIRREAGDFTLTGTGEVMGTPHYMAPEQFDNPLAVDHRADIYSLGVVLYEMLTGELPIGRFAPPSQKVQIDVRLDEVVLKTLENKPERRYQKASEVKTEVETITQGSHQVLSNQDNGLAAKESQHRIPLTWRGIVAITIGIAGGFYVGHDSEFGPLVWIIGGFGLAGLYTFALYKSWNTPRAWFISFFLVVAIIVWLPFLLFTPQPILDWFYGVTGMEPGPDDVMGARFLAALALVLLVNFLRVAWRKGPSELLAQRGQPPTPTSVDSTEPGKTVSEILPPGHAPRLLFMAIGAALSGGVILVGAGLVIYGFLAERLGSPEFWGWMGGGLGCAGGGGGGLFGAYRQYRHFTRGGEPDPSSLGDPKKTLAGLAVCMVLCGLLTIAGIALLPVAFLTQSIGSNDFWGFIGVAMGCGVGGVGGLVGSWSSYRRLEGAPDLMDEPGWTWFDTGIFVIALLGVLTLITIFVVSPVTGWFERTSAYSIVLMGGIVTFIGGMGLIMRALSRRAIRQEAISVSGAGASSRPEHIGEPTEPHRFNWKKSLGLVVIVISLIGVIYGVGNVFFVEQAPDLLVNAVGEHVREAAEHAAAISRDKTIVGLILFGAGLLIGLVLIVQGHRGSRWRNDSSSQVVTDEKASAEGERHEITVPSTPGVSAAIKKRWLTWYSTKSPTQMRLIKALLFIATFVCLYAWVWPSSTSSSWGYARCRLGVPSPWLEYKYDPRGAGSYTGVRIYPSISLLFIFGYILAYSGYLSIRGAETKPSPSKWELRCFKIGTNGFLIGALVYFAWNVYALTPGAVSIFPSQADVGNPTLKDSFEGEWINEDPNTTGITRVYIGKHEGRMRVQIFGKCHPEDCDWGLVQARYQGQSLIAHANPDFGNARVTLELDRSDVLTAYVNTQYNNGGGNKHSIYRLTRKPASDELLNPNAPNVIRSFNPPDTPIDSDHVMEVGDSWRLNVGGPQTIYLFEVSLGNLEEGRLVYEAQLKTENLQGRAYLEMLTVTPDLHETFMGKNNTVEGTRDWGRHEVSCPVNKRRFPDRVQLRLVTEGKGTIWIRDIRLLQNSSYPVTLPNEPKVTRTLSLPDSPIDADRLTQVGDSWMLHFAGADTIRLFEIPAEQIEAGRLTYEVKLKGENFQGEALLEMRTYSPEPDEVLRRKADEIDGTTDWSTHQLWYDVPDEDIPNRIHLNLVLDGKGAIWIKDVRLLQDPSVRTTIPEGPNVIRAFTTEDPTIQAISVDKEDDAWRLSFSEDRTFRLFEVYPKGPLKGGVLTCRARLRSEDVTGWASLQGWVRLPSQPGETGDRVESSFQSGNQRAVSGTTDWSMYEISFSLEKHRIPDLIRLNVGVQGRGTVWIKDVEFLHTSQN